MVDNHWDAVESDYVLTEIGGWSELPGDGSRRIVVCIAEKGLAWRRLTVKGTPGHGSMPYRTDNALVTAAEVVRRISNYRPSPWVGDLWLEQLAGLNLPESTKRALADPAALDDALAELPAGLGRLCHAVTHMTFSPNVAQGARRQTPSRTMSYSKSTSARSLAQPPKMSTPISRRRSATWQIASK